MRKRNWLIHPFLIAPYPVLMLYSRNLHTVEFSETLLPAGLLLLAALIGLASLRALRLDGPRAALLVSAGLILAFSYGPGERLAIRLGISSSLVIREGVVVAIELLAMASVIATVVLKPSFAQALTGMCNASAVGLVTIGLASLLNQSWQQPTTRPPIVEARAVPHLDPPPGRLPDVYFLVLDAYGRSDVLKDVTGFDNSAFLARLEGKGFLVARRSTANYCQTALALSATLNLRYLDDLAGNLSDDRRPLKRLIAGSSAFRAFHQMGYRLVTFDSGFDATESIEADLSLGPVGSLRTFPTLVIDQTPAWLVPGLRSTHQPHKRHRDRILKVFNDLPTSGHPSGPPTLTFAHIVSPHPPFVFDAEGRDVSEREGTYSLNDSEGWRNTAKHGGSEDYACRYGNQVRYITARVEDVIDRILATSPVEPIIVIQGDHGPGSHFEAGADKPNDLRERMTILNAIYLPRAQRGSIPDSITPINTLRLVFDRCFGGRLGLLEDRNYYSPYQRPYDFTEVTGKVDSPDR